MPGSGSRRQFVSSSLLGTAAFAATLPDWIRNLPPVSANEIAPASRNSRVDRSVEPLVQLIETSNRNRVIEDIAAKIRKGTSYREILAALLLAGVRNVQPRPSVGFKFHCVLVVNSCHLASLAGPESDRWLPLLWGIDYFKSSQADEARRSGWTLPRVNERLVPGATQAPQQFITAMENWDEEQADTATAGLVRSLGAKQIFELFAQYAARDYRSIGHKAIYLANAWRTLQVIGWEFAEPVMRSLAFALLNHNGEPNPARSDLAPDQSWRKTQQLAEELPGNWHEGPLNSDAVRTILKVARTGTATDALENAAGILSQPTAAASVWDGIFVGAGELLMRQPGIIGLHGLTTANAVHYLWKHVSDDMLRRRLILQACAFQPQFRESARRRGKLASLDIDQVRATEFRKAGPEACSEILADVSRRRLTAARKLHGFLEAGGNAEQFTNAARQLLFTKGRDAHDYKYSSAVLEDFQHVSPEWRNEFLALSVFNLRGSGDQDNQLIQRCRNLL